MSICAGPVDGAHQTPYITVIDVFKSVRYTNPPYEFNIVYLIDALKMFHPGCRIAVFHE